MLRMFRLFGMVAIAAIMVIGCGGCGGCSNKGGENGTVVTDKPASTSKYVPKAHCLKSTDNGNSWKENMKDIKVNEVFYLQFQVEITTDVLTSIIGGEKNTVPFSIAIPATDILECTLTDYDGTMNTVPASDSFNNIIRYDFKTVASDKPQTSKVIFQCRARDVGNHRLVLTYGSQVNENYAKNWTMVYN